MSIERDDRDDAEGGGGPQGGVITGDRTESGGDDAGSSGTHGGIAIGRTTGMGAGIADGGTPGAGDDEAESVEEGGAVE